MKIAPTLAGILPLITALALLAGCDEPTPDIDAGADDAAAQTVSVSVVELAPQTWRGTIRAFGVIEALEEVDVAAELSGTVSRVHVNEGDRVETGQLLLELDPHKRELAVERAGEALAQARAALEEARLRLQRRRDLAERETISREALDNAQLAVDGASASYQQAQASLRLAERELADTRIVSPTDGLVDVKAVEPGEPVQAGASLVTLQAVAGLRVQTWVSEADVLRLRPGSDATIVPSGLPGSEFPARIEWVGVNAHPETGNFQVKLILPPGSDLLRPGMTVAAELQAEAVEDVLVLPEAALVDRERRRVVFVVERGRAVMREPQLSAGLSARLLVIAGLEPGDKVVTTGQQRLVDGTPVRIAGIK